jgi:tRNA(Glu) U13 pseudouridine synthase TruD
MGGNWLLQTLLASQSSGLADRTGHVLALSVNPLKEDVMTEEIKALLDRMHECAAEAFFAAERFGKGSPQHILQHALYSDAAKHYEDACKSAGREAYATYDD